MDPNLIHQLPEFGFIAHENGVHYAAGFLRRIEGSRLAQLDGLIANPLFLNKTRSAALDLIVIALKQKAQGLGLEGILSYTKDRATLKRSVRHGFSVLPHVAIALNF